MTVNMIPCMRLQGRYCGRYLLLKQFWVVSVGQLVGGVPPPIVRYLLRRIVAFPGAPFLYALWYDFRVFKATSIGHPDGDIMSLKILSSDGCSLHADLNL